MFVDRDDLALVAVQADSLEETGDDTLPRNDRVGVGAALHVEAVRAARDEVGVECLLAVVVIDVDRPGQPSVNPYLGIAQYGVFGLRIGSRSSWLP
jgi:hypothetical protein